VLIWFQSVKKERGNEEPSRDGSTNAIVQVPAGRAGSFTDMIHSQKLLSLQQIFPVEVGPTSDSSIPNQGASGTSMQVRNLRFETEVGVT
jgi:hypothetical protein